MKLCVVGCERSGTSAISTLISISSGLSLLDDPPISWYIYPLVHLHGRGFPLKLLINIQRYNIVKIPGFATILTELKKIQFGKFKVIYF